MKAATVTAAKNCRTFRNVTDSFRQKSKRLFPAFHTYYSPLKPTEAKFSWTRVQVRCFSANRKPVYSCSKCGHQQFKWTGKCPECEEWNTLLEDRYDEVLQSNEVGKNAKYSHSWIGDDGAYGSRKNGESLNFELETLHEVERHPKGWQQTKINVSDLEMSRVLGGGLTAGSLTLLAGSPGVGKSTLALQLALTLDDGYYGDSTARVNDRKNRKKVLYMAGEESASQVKQRAERLCPNTSGLENGTSKKSTDCENAENDGLQNVAILSESNLEILLQHLSSPKIRENPYGAIIVDSIQVMTLPHETSQPGSVTQVRSCATQLLRYAKQSGVPVLMVGHITKSGEVAGPRVLEHLVDVVLYLEGDPNSDNRWLRSKKNRFGANEVGIFEMGSTGLHGVLNPSEMFVSSLNRDGDDNTLPNGVGWTITTEASGSTRAFAAEIQALSHDCAHESLPPRSRCTGIHTDRVQLILAVLSIHAGMKQLRQQDVFVNIIGGLKLEETGADLAVAMSLASAFYGKQIRVSENGSPAAFIGEIGLGGEIRAVKQMEARLSVAARLGIEIVFIPSKTKSVDIAQFEKDNTVQIVQVASVGEAIRLGLGVSPVPKKTRRSKKASNVPRSIRASVKSEEEVEESDTFVPSDNKSSPKADAKDRILSRSPAQKRMDTEEYQMNTEKKRKKNFGVINTKPDNNTARSVSGSFCFEEHAPEKPRNTKKVTKNNDSSFLKGDQRGSVESVSESFGFAEPSTNKRGFQAQVDVDSETVQQVNDERESKRPEYTSDPFDFTKPFNAKK